jgi:adenylate cyclase class IV
VKKPIENEIKIRVDDGLAKARALLRRRGFSIMTPRVFEQNLVLDDAQESLRECGMLLRVRGAGKRGRLGKPGGDELVTCTFKGPEMPGRHKRREERELHGTRGPSAMGG